ncbi:MAG: GerMN domain-containing protein [Acidimicrobiaceae bacterium]|nr:GerMN domain-containing protein [Acidimicrobiaceae bacterium]
MSKNRKSRQRFRYFCGVSLLVLSGCGVPSASDFTRIAESDIPFELNVTTTTTSSTTTTTTTSPDLEMPGGSSSSTLPEIINETVDLYYISANRVLATKLPIVSPATTSQVLAALIAGPPSGDAGAGLRSALSTTLTASVDISKGIATIDTSAEFLNGLSPIDQRLAIAQLVLTFTRRPGVGQVIFSVEGIQIAVPRGRGDLAKPGTPVSYDDYASLLIDRTG